jgi:predicted enzyme related to lactoylglutathione lyase
MANPFVHIELSTSDLGAAKEFYTALFDWSLSDVPLGPEHSYTMIDVGEGTGGGMMTHPMPGAPSMWLPYAKVDDVKAATGKARELGAKIMREPMRVMDAGWLSIIIDPTGAMLGMWQPMSKT